MREGPPAPAPLPPRCPINLATAASSPTCQAPAAWGQHAPWRPLAFRGHGRAGRRAGWPDGLFPKCLRGPGGAGALGRGSLCPPVGSRDSCDAPARVTLRLWEVPSCPRFLRSRWRAALATPARQGGSGGVEGGCWAGQAVPEPASWGRDPGGPVAASGGASQQQCSPRWRQRFAECGGVSGVVPIPAGRPSKGSWAHTASPGGCVLLRLPQDQVPGRWRRL